jgi:iron complex outermembrane receptor protein
MKRRSATARLHLCITAAALITGPLLSASPVDAGGDTDVDYADMTLEQLIDIPVYSASKHDERTTEAPSSVTLITAQEIRAYGWRTLGDLLRSTPGFYVSTPRSYGFIGVRGFGRPRDFGGRILMLVNGHRMNDPLYDTAAIVEDFILDMDLIDRVEVVRGPGSALYGNNAFFGVVNVITKRGGDIGGIEAGGGAGTYATYRGRLTSGARTAGGTEALVSASGFTSDGNPVVYLPKFDGVLRDADGESAHRFLASLGRGGLTVEGFYVGRDKDAPPGYGTLTLPRHTFDARGFAEIRYEWRLAESATASAGARYDRYDYVGEYPFDLAEPGQPFILSINRDESIMESAGGELQLNWNARPRHATTLGVEYRDDFRLMMKNFDVSPRIDYLDIDRHTRSVGFYAQDAYRPLTNLVLTAGVRYDRYDTFGGTVNPRLACVYNHAETTTLKLLYGTAFRAPNANEFYYEDDGLSTKLNPDMKPERIRTYEIVCERRIGREWRASALAFYNDVTDLIDAVVDPADSLYYSANLDEVQALGAELSVNGQLTDRIRARAGYTYVKTEDRATGEPLDNSPEHLGKINLTAPVFRDRLFIGGEAQYISKRTTANGETIRDQCLVNATLSSVRIGDTWEFSASVYNLFDARYSDPTSGDLDVVEQDGRTFRVRAVCRFRRF